MAPACLGPPSNRSPRRSLCQPSLVQSMGTNLWPLTLRHHHFSKRLPFLPLANSPESGQTRSFKAVTSPDLSPKSPLAARLLGPVEETFVNLFTSWSDLASPLCSLEGALSCLWQSPTTLVTSLFRSPYAGNFAAIAKGTTRGQPGPSSCSGSKCSY